MDFDRELTIVRNRIAQAEEDLRSEIRTINDEASARTIAAVRKFEKTTAPLRGILYAMESSKSEGTDSFSTGDLSAPSVSSGSSETTLSMTDNTAAGEERTEEAVPPQREKESVVVPPQENESDVRDGQTGRASVPLVPSSSDNERRSGRKRTTVRVEGIEDPKSSRHLILAILRREGGPVPFPALDHAVMDAKMTRSAGEKSRRTLLNSGLVERIGNSLKINDKGLEELARIERRAAD